MSNTQVQELTYDMVFSFQKKIFDSFEMSIDAVTKNLAKMGAVALSANAYMNHQAKKTADESMQLRNLARQLGITTEAYQKLQMVSAEEGISQGAVESSLATLSKVKENMALGQGDFMAWGQLGINPENFKDSNDLLMAIGDSVKKIDNDARSINIMERLGISAEMLPLLSKGSKEIKDMQKFYQQVGATRTTEDIKWAESFTTASKKVGAVLDGVSSKISTQFMKHLTPVLERFSQWWSDNGEYINKIIQTMIKLTQKLSSVVGSIFKHLARTGLTFVDAMGGMERAIQVVGVAFVWLKRRAITSFMAMIAPAVLLYVALEDIVGFLSGKDSAIGNLFGITPEMMQKIGAMDIIFESVAEVLKTIGEVLSSIVDDVKFAVATWTKYGFGGTVQRAVVNTSSYNEGLNKLEKNKALFNAGAKTIKLEVKANIQEGILLDVIHSGAQDQIKAKGMK